MTPLELPALVTRLVRLGRECEWVEFKQDKAEPKEIGENISAISNASALRGESAGFIVWGVRDSSQDVVGTSFEPYRFKAKGNEDLVPWLARQLDPSVDFQFHEGTCEGHRVVVLEIPAASRPVAFDRNRFIRIDSHTKPLRDYPEKEKALWARLDDLPFEAKLAKESVEIDTALSLLDYPAFFELTSKPLPETKSGIVDALVQDRLLYRDPVRGYAVTNLGAILFARNIAEFPRLARKAFRVIVYKGRSKLEAIREQIGHRGYAVGFAGLIAYVNQQLPRNEEIGQAFRREVPMYPELAIRELVANALIHQDFSLTGTGPMIEIFADRVEIGNPGRSLVDELRLIDCAPRSRNEALASFMRRINVCEERGSGMKKVAHQAELFQLPAPQFLNGPDHFRATMFAIRKFAELDSDDRIRACYQHAVLRYGQGDPMTNASLRKRLSIADKNYSMASRIIRETLDANLIRPSDSDSGSRATRSYVPFWA